MQLPANDYDRKYIRQLSVLARLRNLTQETQKQVTDMGLLYDITKGYLYQEGLAKGEEKGAENTRREMIVEMLRDGTLAHHKIAALAKVPIEYVTEIAQELKA